jgi:hypothetical protein
LPAPPLNLNFSFKDSEKLARVENTEKKKSKFCKEEEKDDPREKLMEIERKKMMEKSDQPKGR